MRRFYAGLTAVSFIFFGSAVFSPPAFADGGSKAMIAEQKSVVDAAHAALPSTGQIEVFRIAPEEYLKALRGLSILVEIAKKAEKEILSILGVPEKKGDKDKEKPRSAQALAADLLSRIPDNEVSAGTGWVWDEKEKLVVTNAHVAEGPDNYYAITFGNGTKAVLGFIGWDKATDVAVFKVVESDGSLPPALTRDLSCTPERGEEVVSIGYPNSLKDAVGSTPPWTVTYGRLIDSPVRAPFDSAFSIMWQVDSQLIGGFSGGPTISVKCGVVGMNRMQGPSRIIPLSTLEHVVGELLAYGEVRRGVLGVEIVSVPNALKTGWFIREGRDPRDFLEKGIIVAGVGPNTPAAQAGIQAGDMILAVNGQQVLEAEELQEAIASVLPGETVKLTFWRKGRTVEGTVVLGSRAKVFDNPK